MALSFFDEKCGTFVQILLLYKTTLQVFLTRSTWTRVRRCSIHSIRPLLRGLIGRPSIISDIPSVSRR